MIPVSPALSELFLFLMMIYVAVVIIQKVISLFRSKS